MQTSDREIGVTATLPAPAELVWKVWTQPEHIAHWWGPNGFTNDIHQMDVVPGGVWRLTMKGPDGQTYPNKSIFQEIDPFRKIVMLHQNPGYLATILFETKENETLLDWKMLFETAELFNTVVRVFRADEGLQQNVEKLQAYLLQLQAK